MSHRSDHCLNCGAPTPDAYCSQCGQRNTDYRESMREVVGEVAEELLQLDSRIAQTVVPFLFQPGKLTKEFVEGRRARYSSPLRLFLFLSAIYFVAGWVAPGKGSVFTIRGKGNNTSVELFGAEAPADAGTEERPLFSPDDGGGFPFDAPDGGETRFQSFQRERVRDWAKETKGSAERRLSDFIFGAIPKAMFVLMPLFALLLALFFRKPKRFYLEHLIFAMHYHAFLFLLMAIAHLVHALRVPLALVAVVYLALALRRVYAQSIWRLSWKIPLLLVVYAFIVIFALAFLAFAAFEFA